MATRLAGIWNMLCGLTCSHQWDFLITYSSQDTQNRAKRLAAEIGASHLNVKIDVVISALLTLFETIFPGKKLKYKVCSFSP